MHCSSSVSQFLLLFDSCEIRRKKGCEYGKGGVSEKGNKIKKYRGIGFDTATGDYDMRLKRTAFSQMFIKLNPCHQFFFN